MQRPFTASMAALCTALLLVGGCGSDRPTADPTPPASTTTTTPTPSPPSMPARARRHTKAGAVAFARHYISVLNYAVRTGDTKKFDALARPTCQSCENVSRKIRRISRGGGRVVGGQWTVRTLEAHAAGDGRILVNATIHFSPQRIYPAKGAKARRYPGGIQVFNFWLSYEHGWRIARSSTAS